jgi:hypothetical protein
MTTCLGPVNPAAPLPVSVNLVADYLGISLAGDTQGEMTIKALILAALDYAETITGRDSIGKVYQSRIYADGIDRLLLRPTLDSANITVTVNGVPVPAGQIDVWAGAGVLSFAQPLSGDVVIDWRTITPTSLLPAEEAAVLLLVQHWWNRRDQGGIINDAPYGVKDLLRSCAMPLAAMLR